MASIKNQVCSGSATPFEEFTIAGTDSLRVLYGLSQVRTLVATSSEIFLHNVNDTYTKVKYTENVCTLDPIGFEYPWSSEVSSVPIPHINVNLISCVFVCSLMLLVESHAHHVRDSQTLS